MRVNDFIHSIKSLDTLQDNERKIGISREKATISLPTDRTDGDFHGIREEKNNSKKSWPCCLLPLVSRRSPGKYTLAVKTVDR